MATFTRVYLTIAFTALAVAWSLGQNNVVMAPGTVNACGGFFVDSGGQNGGYSPNEDITLTICAQAGAPGGTHVQLFFPNVDIASGDILCFYDGTDTTATLLACHDEFQGGPALMQATAANTSGCLTIIFVSGDNGGGQGWSAQIRCIAACQTIQAALSSTTPVVSPPDTGWIDICPRDRVQFSAQGLYPQNGIIYQHSDLTSSFEWDFGDGNTAVGPNANHAFIRPGGYIVQLTITDQFGCRNTNFISQRVRVSTLPVYEFGDLPEDVCVGDTISLRAGVEIMDDSLDVAAMSVVGGFQQGGVVSDTLALPDGNGVSYTSSIGLTQFPPGAVLTNVNDILGVCLKLEHSYGGDLDIELICPNGQSVDILQFGSGVGSTNFGEPFASGPIDGQSSDLTPGIPYEYCFRMFDTDFGTLPQESNSHTYTYTTVPSNITGNTFTYTDRYFPEGSYRPQQSFNNLLGCPLNGEWSIRVQDNLNLDNGWLFEWSISFAPELFAVLEVFQPVFTDWGWRPDPTIFNATQGAIDASPDVAGSARYVFFVENDFGCVFDTAVNVRVLPPTHPDCYNCDDNLTPVPDTTVCVGVPVLLDAFADVELVTVVPFQIRPNYEYGFLTHPYNAPYNSVMNINSIAPATITNPAEQIESVCININTLWAGDLRIFLRAPSGALLELSTNNGGNGDNYTNTCFTPTATTPITAGAPPFTGNFLPEGNWNILTGSAVNGNWALVVSDGFGVNDVNNLISWRITFRSTNAITYTWAPPTNLSCTNCPDPTSTPTATRVYTVTATDLYGCLHADTVTVNVVSAVPPVTGLTCSTTDLGVMTFTWNAIPGITAYEYRLTRNGVVGPWEGPISDLSVVVAGLLNGDEVTIEVRASIGSSAQGCNVETATTTCIFESCDLAAMPLAITNVLATPVLCHGDETGTATVVANGGIGAYTFQWDDPLQQISQTANFLPAGAYSVTVMDEVGCERAGVIMVNQPTPLMASTSSMPALCFGSTDGMATAQPTGGTSPYTYLWDNGQATQTATGYAAGQYNVTVTDNNGCTITTTAAVDQPTAPVSVAITQTLSGCFGEQTNQAQALAEGGTGTGYTYVWSDGQAGNSAINLAQGTVGVTATDANGCTGITEVSLANLEPISLNIIIGPASCFDYADGQMGINAVSGGAGQPGNPNSYTFQWSSGQTGPTANNLAGGQSYSVTVTDTQGCTGVESRFLPQPLPITFEVAHTDALCFGSTDGTATISNVSGSQTLFTFAWSGPSGTQTGATAENLAAGTYIATVTDITGCFGIQSVTIGQPTAIDVQFSVDNVKCFGQAQGTVEIKASGGTPGYTYQWPNGGTTVGQEGLVAGTYAVTITDANACTSVRTVDVSQPALLEAEVIPLGVTCYDDRDGRIHITPQGGTPPYRYSLDNQTFDGASQRIGLRGGDYSVYVRDVHGCLFLADVKVPEPEEFIVDAGEDMTINLGDSVQVAAASTNGWGQITYVWSAPYDGTLSCTECDAPFASPTYTITYELYGMDENGCESTDLLHVFVRKPRLVAVPTGFTPNGDGQNDRLIVHGLPQTQIAYFQVFDRWGELVFELRDFEVNDPNAGWDGTFKGQPMNGGVFVWTLKAVYPFDGEEEVLRGQTTLIR